MEAKLVTYTTEMLNRSEKSILSKVLFGYVDKSNNSNYVYRRDGLLQSKSFIKICNNTFIISIDDWPSIKGELQARKATIKEWDIVIKNF